MSLPKREEYLRAAILTKDNITSINTNLRVVTSSIPRSQIRNTGVKKKQLAATDISEIIRLVKGAASAEIHRPSLSGGTLTSLITKYHKHTEVMKSNQILHYHARRLANLMEYSLMQIKEYQDGGNKSASAAVSGPASLRLR